MRLRVENDARRAARLLRWYPPAWRDRYGEEFTELLLSDIADRPRSLARTLDVTRSGLLARATATGLTGSTAESHEQVRANLAALTCVLALFMAFGVGMWSQLMVGWQWSAPDTVVTAAAAVAMSIGVVAFAVLAACAAIPVVWGALCAIKRREAHGLLLPLLMFGIGTAVLVYGSRHFGHSWPGTGGHPWPAKDLVPGSVAAFGWALTRGVTSYWAHPAALGSFSAAEIAWMGVSPVAMACVAIGAAKTVRRAGLSPRALRFETRLAGAAVFVMFLLLAAASCWVVVGGAGPRNLFQTGIINFVGLAVMTAMMMLAVRVAQRARDVSREWLA